MNSCCKLFVFINKISHQFAIINQHIFTATDTEWCVFIFACTQIVHLACENCNIFAMKVQCVCPASTIWWMVAALSTGCTKSLSQCGWVVKPNRSYIVHHRVDDLQLFAGTPEVAKMRDGYIYYSCPECGSWHSQIIAKSAVVYEWRRY